MEGMGRVKNMFGGVYQGRRVLVTGHTGFKGSWLTLWLAELGANVYGYALEPPTSPNLFEEAHVPSALARHEIGDVRDCSHLQSYLSEVKPDIVFHLAAQPLVRLSYEEPLATYATNVMGTVHLLEAVRHVDSVRVCQVITSDKCYENRECVYAYRENDPMGGYDPYSNSKGCAELVVSSYRQSFFHPDKISEHGVSLSSVRAGNVIGGGDWAENRIIPDCIRALSRGEPIQVRNQHAIRPWQHVLEPLSGYLWLAAKQYQEPGCYEEGWNFGPMGTCDMNVRQIVELIVNAWGNGSWQAQNTTIHVFHEAKFLKLDVTKANTLLSWSPVCSVPESVADTVIWYRLYQDKGSDMKSFTLGQIRSYYGKAVNTGLDWAGKGSKS